MSVRLASGFDEIVYFLPIIMCIISFVKPVLEIVPVFIFLVFNYLVFFSDQFFIYIGCIDQANCENDTDYN